MGFLSSCNFFTESDFDDYRRLDKVLNEADDDDLNDDESESNFDMPDDDDQDDNTQQNTSDNIQTQDNEDNDLNDDESESNFDIPDDEENTDAQSIQTQDDTSGASDESEDGESNFDLPDDNNQQDTSGDTGEGQGDSGDDLGDDESESNFDMDDNAGEGDSGDGTDNTDEDGMDDTSTMGTDPDQDLQDAENDIFNGLSDQDKVIKINELKDLYQDLYNRIVTLYDKVNDIPKEDDLIKVYNFIIDNLSDLKQFVYDYLTNTFENKTYLENLVNYKKYLSTLNVINGILEEIRKGLYKESGN